MLAAMIGDRLKETVSDTTTRVLEAAAGMRAAMTWVAALAIAALALASLALLTARRGTP